jgi:DNA-damage-inducible protein J
MALATLNVRIDENVKRRFDHFCADVGMTATTAVNLFARAVLREGKIPFEIAEERTPPFVVKSMNDVYEKLEEAENSLAAGVPSIDAKDFFSGLRQKYGYGKIPS